MVNAVKYNLSDGNILVMFHKCVFGHLSDAGKTLLGNRKFTMSCYNLVIEADAENDIGMNIGY